MTTLRKAAQQALEALDEATNYTSCTTWSPSMTEVCHAAVAALRAALAETREHITDGSPCWCNPETTYVDPDTGVSVIVHKEPQ